MNQDDLTKEQARKLWEQTGPSVRFFNALRNRMEQQAFPRDDELYVLVKRAADATHSLAVALHYLSCDGRGETAAEVRLPSGSGGAGGTWPS